MSTTYQRPSNPSNALALIARLRERLERLIEQSSPGGCLARWPSHGYLRARARWLLNALDVIEREVRGDTIEGRPSPDPTPEEIAAEARAIRKEKGELVS